MEMVQGLDIQWKNAKQNLKDAVNKDRLPQILQVCHKFIINSSESLFEDERIVVHAVKTVALLRGKDRDSKQATFPISCPFELKYSVNDGGKVYKTVGDLCATTPVPKRVKMTGDVKGEEVQGLGKDESLKVLLTERNDKGPSFVHFRSEKGKHLRLSVTFEGNFVSLPPDDNVHTLEELATKELPFCVEFSPVDGKPPFDKKLGIVTLTEGLTCDYVFASTKRKGKRAAVILPLSADLKVQQANVVNSPQGTELNLNEDIELPKFSAQLGMHKLESVACGLLVPFDTLGVNRKVPSQGSVKSQKSEDEVKEVEKDEPKKKESESSEKKGKGVREKAIRRMSKAKMLVKKRHKSMEAKQEQEQEVDIECEKEAVTPTPEPPISRVSAPEPLSNRVSLHEVTSSRASAPEPPPQNEDNQTIEEDMYLPPAEIKESSPAPITMNGAHSPDAVAPAPAIYDDVEVPSYDDVESATYDDVGPIEEGSDDDYEMPQLTPPGAVDTYKAPPRPASAPTMPRTAKDKGEKGIFSKMWKKVKKGATLPNMTPSQMKKMQKHISGDDSDGREFAPSDVPPPSSEPEPIPTFDDEDLYEEIGEGYISADLVKAARTAHRFSFSTAPLPPKPPDSGDSGFGDDDMKELQKLRATMPPELPGNHPIVGGPGRGGTIKFKNFCDTVKASEAEIRKWSLDDVESTLKQLMLQKYVEQFIDNQIDGPLLVDLDEAVFRDLGLSIFEARKLRKFVFGWRPDHMKEQPYLALKKEDNVDPTQWDEAQVVDHMNILALDKFANFCRQNQVNGDLLVDIVADDEVLNEVFKDGKLKTVKLKKYVLEGWRPQAKVYDTHENIQESQDTYEVPSPTEERAAWGRKGVKSIVITSSGGHYEGLSRSNSSPSTASRGATFPRSQPTSAESEESVTVGKFRQAKDTYLKQASRPDTKPHNQRKTLKESPLIANIKQQLMEKSGNSS